LAVIGWFRSTGSGAKETLCHHDCLGSGKGSGAQATLCHHIPWVPVKVLVKVPALKRLFAIMISRVPVQVPALIRDPFPS